MKTQIAIQHFCDSLFARGRSVRTVDEYRKRLRVLPDELERIQPEDLDQLLAGMRRRGLAAATLASAVQSFKTFLGWCAKRGYLASSPAAELVRPRVELDGRAKAISQSDLERMIAEARKEEDRLGLAVLYVLADTGCRAGELCALNLVDLSLEDGEAYTQGKTGKRVLDFTSTTEEALGEWLRVRPDADPGAVFTNEAGRMTIWALYSLLASIAKAAGVVQN